MRLTVKQIREANPGQKLATWLKENGFDGLCGQECGCSVKELAPCVTGDESLDIEECVAARLTLWNSDRCKSHCLLFGTCEHYEECGKIPGGGCYSPAELPAGVNML